MDGKKIFPKNIWGFDTEIFSVCACGKWICTSKKCPEKHEKEGQNLQNIKNAVDNEDNSDEYYYDDDDYEEDPEDDPDVEDINWF